ncbi:hypothetical protein [Streptomyces sp. S1D4-20]|uniref:hypothetical protein n=1 Tax=Streptomyces sp. S1D4-20 TaxID=2594462 RepID=UPI0011626B44|nr:hypothetical protein [Streptomyces sp. S1D4-20]QDN54201.1 hypothetical protein FNV67_01120 [Streptomyces sp. S1D4-20]
MAEHDADIDLAIDFDGAAATRGEILQTLEGQLDADVVQALQQPGTPDWLLAQPFQVVERLGELQGPADGAGRNLSPRWSTPALGHDGTQEDLVDLYRQVLMHGSTDDQRSVLAAGQLVALWGAVRAGVPTAIAHVWEQRFPELDPRGR